MSLSEHPFLYRTVGRFFVGGCDPNLRQRLKPLGGCGDMFPWEMLNLGMHFVRFGSMMRKQADKSDLKNVDITQTVKLQWIFLRRGYIMYLQF